MARAYRMTSARRAAIKKAQAASARKRRGKRKRKIATGVGIVGGLGVVGVTMYAANKGMKKRKSQKQSSVGVVTETIQMSTSKEIDVIRTGIYDSVERGLDYSEIGAREHQNPSGTLSIDRITRAQKKAAKAARGRRGRKKNVVDSSGVVTPLVRFRPNYNDDRRSKYRPSVRHGEYIDARDRQDPPPWLSKDKKK